MNKSKQDSLKIILVIVLAALTLVAVWLSALLIDNAMSNNIGRYKDPVHIQLPTISDVGKYKGER